MRELSPGSVVAGHRIEELVARGGMGVVYRVTHLALERERALKLIAPELAADEDFRARFRREWKLAASIDHPHALPIHDAGEADGLLYIAMRYVHGTDLRQMIRERPLSPELAATIIGQVADALDAAHSLGLIHRDIKPANILVETRDGEPHAYLTDFGLTKHAASTVQLTDEGRWVGTVDYVAPEQIEGGSVDARTDIYGLGCVACQCLTGEVPYPRDTDVAKIWAHLNQPPPSVHDRAPNLARALDEVVTRAMAKAPEDRYLSAGDMGRALHAAALGESYAGPERSVASGEAASGKPSAPPPTRLASRARRWRELRRVASVGVALAFLLAVAVVAIVLKGGSDDNTVLARQELVKFQSQVGRICDDRNAVNKATSQRAPAYRRRLRRAKDLQDIRDAVIDERQYGIRAASNLSSRLAGLGPPSDELTATQRRTVLNWRANLSQLRAYRDRLKRIGSYGDLVRVVRRFDRHDKTVLDRRSDRVTEGLQRLGESSCDLEIEPATGSSPLPPDPARRGSQASTGGGSTSSSGSGQGSGSGTGSGSTSPDAGGTSPDTGSSGGSSGGGTLPDSGGGSAPPPDSGGGGSSGGGAGGGE